MILMNSYNVFFPHTKEGGKEEIEKEKRRRKQGGKERIEEPVEFVTGVTIGDGDFHETSWNEIS